MNAGGPHIVRAPRPARGYEILPHALLRDIRLSFRAIGLAARLLTNADGYRMPMAALVDEARRIPGKSSREGRDALRTALRELCDAGYVEHRKTQDERGRWSTETWIYDMPPKPGFQVPVSPTPEIPASGEPDVGASGRKSSKPIRNIKSSSMHDAGATAPFEKKPVEQKRRRHHAPTGLVYWYSDELTEVEALVAEYGLQDVRAVAATILEQGYEPLPGVVARDLQRRRKAARKAVDAAATAARKREEEAAAAAKRSDPAAQARNRTAMEKACRDRGVQPPPSR